MLRSAKYYVTHVAGEAYRGVLKMRVKRFHIKKIGGEEFVYINAKVFNPDDPKRFKSLEFLVDTGAAGCAHGTAHLLL